VVFGKVNIMTVSNAAGQHTLRERNVALVAQEIFMSEAPLSRAAIAASTGLTRATVSSLVDLLVDSQLVAELPPAVSKRAGRPAVPLIPATGTFFGIGLEVNVHYLGGVIVDLTGKEFGRTIVEGDYRGSNPAEVMTELGRIAAELAHNAINSVQRPGRTTPTIAGVNVALPGLIDPANSALRVAPNLGWKDLSPVDTSPISRALEPVAGRAVTVEIGNEANLGALAQIALGALHTFVYVSAEVGIGSSIVLDKDVFLGRRGWSGELGHVTVDPSGPLCSCGSRGCLEQYAGQASLMKNAGLPDDTPVSVLVERLEVGDETAHSAVQIAGEALGRALADFINLIDIHMVVLGGIYHELASFLTPVVEDKLKAHVLSAKWSTFEVIAAPIGEGASLLGGATSVTRAVSADPARWISESEDA